MHDPRGSLWRKWDLHVHTPSSYDYLDKSVPDEVFVERLVEEGISAVAVTDHDGIDIARIQSLRRLAKGKIIIFPGVEFRIERGGRDSIHITGIFPEDSDLQTLQSILEVQLGAPKMNAPKEAHEKFYVYVEKAAECIHERCGGVVVIHAGKKAGSIERIANGELHKELQKTDLLRNCVDLLEVNKEADAHDYHRIVFPDIGFEKPVVLTSDCHDARKRIRKASCWIKADLSFLGLRQVLCEASDRVYIGEEPPPKLQHISRDPAKYITGIAIDKKPESDLSEVWFEHIDLPVNPGLVAIIGPKGSGKSALSDVLALCGEASCREFSFLDAQHFCNKSRKAQHFYARLKWANGDVSEKDLDADEAPVLERVRYIPQKRLEAICNEIASGAPSSFDKELRNVIFSHVSPDERLGKQSLDDLIAYQTEETERRLGILRAEMKAINAEIANLEDRLSPDHRKSIQERILARESSLRIHESQKPAKVDPPAGQDPVVAKLTEQISGLQKELTGMANEAEALSQEREANLRRISAARRLTERIVNLQRTIDKFREDSAEDLRVLGLEISSVLKVSLESEPVSDLQKRSETRNKEIDRLLDASTPDGPVHGIQGIMAQIATLRKELDGPSQAYQKYLAALEKWQKDRDEIVGTSDSVGSLVNLKEQMDELSTVVPKALSEAQRKRMDTAREIYREISKLVNVYKELYAPVQRFVQSHPVAKKVQLNFSAAVLESGFVDGLIARINQGVKGSFYGSGPVVARALLSQHSFVTEDGCAVFLESVLDLLTHDRRDGGSEPVALEGQLKKGRSRQELYDWLFSLEYLRPSYQIQLGTRDLEQLSPGEKGAVLLMFYLLVDRDETPLIIDQPEDNLDNQSVYEFLVPCLREAKNRRQVIIVTHNPNLAVVCDAEQVIYSSINKSAGFRVSYEAGAIDNPEINRHVVNVLEGTWPAFRKREDKYEPEDAQDASR